MGWTQPQALPDAELDRLAAEFGIDRGAANHEAENARAFDTRERHIEHVIQVYRAMDKDSAARFIDALHAALDRQARPPR
jgi:hypothetical protein